MRILFPKAEYPAVTFNRSVVVILRSNLVIQVLIIFFLCIAVSICAQETKVFEWQQQQSGSTASLRGVSTVSESVAWASGSGSTWLRTVDGGNTWHVGKVPGAELDFRDVQGFDAETAILLSAGSPGRIFKTNDGGDTWRATWSSDDKDVFMDGMAFWDERHGVAVGDPLSGGFMVLVTDDGGESWSRIPVAAIPDPLPREAMFAASGTCVSVGKDGDAWFCTGGGAARVFHSTDWGRTWKANSTLLLPSASSQGLFSVLFVDSIKGVAVGGDFQNPESADNNLILSNDGGKTWQKNEGDGGPGGYRSAVAVHSFRGKSVLVAVGRAGGDYSLDGGKTWFSLGAEGFYAFSSVPGDSLKIGWAVGAEGRIAFLVASDKK